jgi:hypothetical protein
MHREDRTVIGLMNVWHFESQSASQGFLMTSAFCTLAISVTPSVKKLCTKSF